MLKRITFLFLVLIVLVYCWPKSFTVPVLHATKKSYDQRSFWFYPWGKSGHHKGVDIFAKKGTPVLSATSGWVIYTGVLSLGGNVVAVLSPGWEIHYYAHLDSMNTSMFSWASKGEHIGSVGTSGNAKGKPAHLHYSIHALIPHIGPHHWIPTERDFYTNPIPLLNNATNQMN